MLYTRIFLFDMHELKICGVKSLIPIESDFVLCLLSL